VIRLVGGVPCDVCAAIDGDARMTRGLILPRDQSSGVRGYVLPMNLGTGYLWAANVACLAPEE